MTRLNYKLWGLSASTGADGWRQDHGLIHPLIDIARGGYYNAARAFLVAKMMDYKQIVRQGYDAIAEEYLAVRSQLHPRDVELLQELVQRLPRGARVLDAGCGAGVPVTRALSQYFRVVGVDFSEEQVRRAQELVPGAEFICEDMTRLDFPQASFDAVCSYYAIIHVPRGEHRRLLEEFCRMLKPSGLVFLCMGGSDIDVDIAEDFLGARMYWSHYDSETNMRMLRECGFTIIWSKLITEQYEFGSGRHLFVLAEKGVA